MARPVVQVDGLRELRAALKSAGADLRDLRRVNLDAARVASAAAAAAAPRRTGALAGSVRAGATQTAGLIRAGTATVPYARPIHWGWPARNIPPSLFAIDAARDSEAAWLAPYVRELDALTRKVARST